MENLISDLTPAQKQNLKKEILEDFSKFVRFAFKVRMGCKWISEKHHEVMLEALQKVINGEITRLILNIPPRHSKSELVSIMVPAYAFCINKNSEIIQTTFSDSLCQEMSDGVKSVIYSPEFQELFGFEPQKNMNSKNDWKIKGGGKFHAVPSGGSVTGKGAGTLNKGFTGLMVIDDLCKPEDMWSPAGRDKVNRRYTNTLSSRLAHDDTPVVIIQQRLHEDDLCGYLLNGGSGEKFHYLMMPVILEHDTGSQEWYDAQGYSHAIPILYDLGIPKGEQRALWERRYSLKRAKILEDGDIYTFSSQYMNEPTPAGGTVFKHEWWQFYDDLPHEEIKFMRIYADTAHKTGEHNDYSVFECWAYSNKGNMYLIDLERGKWEAPELLLNFKKFYEKWKKNKAFKGLPYSHFKLNCAKIEDKASGIGLIQELKKSPGVIVVPIKRLKDKVTRAMGVAPIVQSGRVFLPRKASFTEKFLQEADSFSPMLGHKHDDQMDPLFDAVEDLVIEGNNYRWTSKMLGI